MDSRVISIPALAICALASIAMLTMTAMLAVMAMPADAFIGAGIDLSKHLGDTINFDLKPVTVTAADAAYGLADTNLGVTWGVNYDINALAGYPYGYGGVGAVTDATVGYDLGLSMDNTYGAGFDGSSWGIPLTSGTTTTTKYNNDISAVDHLQNVQASLLY